MIKAFIITIAALFLNSINAAASAETLPSIEIGTLEDREFITKYVCALNIAIGKGIGIKNFSQDTITVKVEYGIWRFQQPLIKTGTVNFTLTAGQTALIIDSYIRIIHIRSILKIWINDALTLNKSRNDILDHNPILSYSYPF